MNRFHTGKETPIEKNKDVEYWTEWVNKRMKDVKEEVEKIDLFIAPSEHLKKRFVEEFKLPEHKVKYALFLKNLYFTKLNILKVHRLRVRH